MSGIEIAQFRVGESNYNYLLYSPTTREALALDPLDADAVGRQAQSMRIHIRGILNTHGHWDHVAGNQDLVQRTGAWLAAYAGEKIPAVSRKLSDTEQLNFEGSSIKILFTPGHTLGHICLQVDERFLLTGDTLFLAGCGNCKFGGNVEQLYESFRKLAQLPGHLKIYCGHEYALKNLDFCMKMDPQNQAAKEMSVKVRQALDQGQAYVSTLAEEKEYNVFMRAACAVAYPQWGDDPKSVFIKLRELKDRF